MVKDTEIYFFMQNLPDHQADNPKDARIATSATHSRCPLDIHCDGFHWTLLEEPGLKLPMGNCMSAYFTGTVIQKTVAMFVTFHLLSL